MLKKPKWRDYLLIYSSSLGHWEVVQKLDLEEDLLKLTEQKRTEDLGIISKDIFYMTATDSFSFFIKCLLSATIRATVLKAFISSLWLRKVSGPFNADSP